MSPEVAESYRLDKLLQDRLLPEAWEHDEAESEIEDENDIDTEDDGFDEINCINAVFKADTGAIQLSVSYLV